MLKGPGLRVIVAPTRHFPTYSLFFFYLYTHIISISVTNCLPLKAMSKICRQRAKVMPKSLLLQTPLGKGVFLVPHTTISPRQPFKFPSIRNLTSPSNLLATHTNRGKAWIMALDLHGNETNRLSFIEVIFEGYVS